MTLYSLYLQVHFGLWISFEASETPFSCISFNLSHKKDGAVLPQSQQSFQKSFENMLN